MANGSFGAVSGRSTWLNVCFPQKQTLKTTEKPEFQGQLTAKSRRRAEIFECLLSGDEVHRELGKLIFRQ
jgi:hypothetical protein